MSIPQNTKSSVMLPRRHQAVKARLRVGRIQLPEFMISDYRQVGYPNTWNRRLNFGWLFFMGNTRQAVRPSPLHDLPSRVVASLASRVQTVCTRS